MHLMELRDGIRVPAEGGACAPAVFSNRRGIIADRGPQIQRFEWRAADTPAAGENRMPQSGGFERGKGEVAHPALFMKGHARAGGPAARSSSMLSWTYG
jgi:hypothetical protein